MGPHLTNGAIIHNLLDYSIFYRVLGNVCTVLWNFRTFCINMCISHPIHMFLWKLWFRIKQFHCIFIVFISPHWQWGRGLFKICTCFVVLFLLKFSIWLFMFVWTTKAWYQKQWHGYGVTMHWCICLSWYIMIYHEKSISFTIRRFPLKTHPSWAPF